MHNKKEYMKMWRKKNKEKIKLSRIKYKKENPWVVVYYSVVYRCRNIKQYIHRENRLTLEEVKTLWFRDKAYLLKKPSIDRINNDEGYYFENCRFIEMQENRRLGMIDFNKKRKNGFSVFNQYPRLYLNDAIFIKSMKGKLKGKELAKKFNVCERTIYSIWQGRTWKESSLKESKDGD